MLIKEDFIVKNNRRYFKAKCDICLSDRGYKTPNHANKPCYSCSNKKANLASQAAKKLKPKQKIKCTLTGCEEQLHGKGLCEKHYNKYIRKKDGAEIKIKECLVCQERFECKSLKASYCSRKCKVSVYNSRHREDVLKRMKHWQKSNKDKRKKYLSVPTNKLAAYLRSRISRAVKNNYKCGSAVKNLGYSIADLKTYLESKFQPGMSWDNYGYRGWHIDHIRPLKSFNLLDPEQFMQACHYTNLQPLWWFDNLSKSDRYES
jgi:hypothetical protein